MGLLSFSMNLRVPIRGAFFVPQEKNGDATISDYTELHMNVTAEIHIPYQRREFL
ncbi:hypothetical protein J25TS5_38350 [Paenibacillus faecis]|nr:hypothetical protein J25TS5_38350 [Paenibacillus faecis]